MPALPVGHSPVDSPNTTQEHHGSSLLASNPAEHNKSHNEDASSPLIIPESLRPRSPNAHSTPGSIISRFQNITPRQVLPPLPLEYYGQNNGPSSGTIVGIVLGVVLGYLLIFWLIVAVIGSRANANYVEGDETEIVVRRGHDSSRRSRRSHKSRRARTEMSSISDAPSRRPQSSRDRPRTERIIVQETRRTESRPPVPVSPRSERAENINISITENRTSGRVHGDNMVVVEEDSSSAATPDPNPRRKRNSGYRTVDPTEYGGGNYPRQDVYESRRSRR